MGQRYTEISDQQKKFIAEQNLFFVGTATADGRVNVSPKGMDSLRVLGNNRVIWLNVTGSGNETSAHVQEDPRMTLMFTALKGNPVILRLYGTARVIHNYDEEWEELYGQFSPTAGARQVFDVAVDLVQTSCGMGVPYYDYVGERDQLVNWAEKKGQDGVEEYWEQKNQVSIDGKPTNVLSSDD